MDDMEHRLGKTRSGLTLIEVMLAVTVLVVGILGAMMFRYYSALDARKADVQVGAGRVALLILEGWKGAAGAVVPTGYNPAEDIALNKDISISGTNNPYTVQLTGGIDTSYSVMLTRVVDVNEPGLAELTVEAASGLFSVKLSDFVRTN
jgi:prepilin-type N-terminal cleavage/methylation domain-containing protein